MHPLDGPRFKVWGAQINLQDLVAEENAFREKTKYEIVRAESNLKTGKDALRIRINAEPTEAWGVRIGEIAHDLRSALDGLIWQLSLLTTKTPARNTQFPIFLRGRTQLRRPSRPGSGRGQLLPHFETDGRRMISNLRPEHQAVIERLQPYKRGNGGPRNPLWLLSEMNNADKHRLLQVVGLTPTAISWMIPRFVEDGEPPAVSLNSRKVLKDGAKVGMAAHDVDVEFILLPSVSFSEGCATVKNLPVVSTLGYIAKHVSEIIERFGPEFP